MANTNTNTQPPAAATSRNTATAGRDFKLNGVEYHRGDTVDITDLSNAKVGQLLNNRYLIPNSDTIAFPSSA